MAKQSNDEVESGIVFRVHTTNFRGRDLYSFRFVDGGEDDWFRMGEKRYEGIIEEGNEVEVTFYEDRKGQLTVTDAVLLAEGEPAPRASRGGRGSSRGSSSRGGRGGGDSSSAKAVPAGGKKEVDWEAKDIKIQYQSSRKDALQHVATLISSESIELPAKTKKGERQTVIDGLVDYYTALYFEDIQGQEAVGRAAAERDAPKTTAKRPSKRVSREEDPDLEDEEDYDDE